MKELTPEEEFEVIQRVVQRGDLHLLGSTLGAVYEIVQEWRIKGGTQRQIDDYIEREKLHNALIDLLDAVDGVSVYPEGSFGFEELAAAQERTETLLKELGYSLTAEGWRRG